MDTYGDKMRLQEMNINIEYDREGIKKILEDYLNMANISGWKFFHARTQKNFSQPELPKAIYSTQGNYRFTIVLEGTNENWIGQAGQMSRYTLIPNDVLLLEPYCCHAGILEKPSVVLFSVLHGNILDIAWEDIKPPDIRMLRYSISINDPGLGQLYRALCSMREYPEVPEASQNLLHILLKLILAQLGKGSIDSRRPEELYRKMLNWLNIHYASDINRERFAKFFGVTPGYVSTLFRRHGNTSFNHMLNDIRVEHAGHFLKNTDMTLEDIASQCGFRYASYFIRVFRRHRHMSPGEFRIF